MALKEVRCKGLLRKRGPLHHIDIGKCVKLYGFTDEKQLKAWQLLCSQRDHSSVKKSEIPDVYIKR